MGLFGRRRSAGTTITAQDLYETIQEILASKVPGLAPTVTEYGVMLLFGPARALMLNLPGLHWVLATLDTEDYPQVRTVSTFQTRFGPADVGELIVWLLEYYAATYGDMLNAPEFAADSDTRTWFVERRAEVLAALTV